MTQVGHIESRVSDMLLTPVQDALSGIDVADRTAALKRVPDDKAMLRAVTELTRDLGTPNPRIFWSDFLASAFLGYAGLFVAIISGNIWLQCAAALVAVLALYRALLFIHELTHLHRDALPGFRTAWNLIVGIPMLMPSFMYEDGHTIHHSRKRYGTPDDPEYLPLALMKPWSLPLFVLVAMLLPVALIVRFGVLYPLGLIIPPLRTFTWERFSSLSINPEFRRKAPEGDFAGRVRWQEAGASLWAVALIASVFVFGWQPLATALVILSLSVNLLGDWLRDALNPRLR